MGFNSGFKGLNKELQICISLLIQCNAFHRYLHVIFKFRANFLAVTMYCCQAEPYSLYRTVWHWIENGTLESTTEDTVPTRCLCLEEGHFFKLSAVACHRIDLYGLHVLLFSSSQKNFEFHFMILF